MNAFKLADELARQHGLVLTAAGDRDPHYRLQSINPPWTVDLWPTFDGRSRVRHFPGPQQCPNLGLPRTWTIYDAVAAVVVAIKNEPVPEWARKPRNW